jgi:hypothetical protein
MSANRRERWVGERNQRQIPGQRSEDTGRRIVAVVPETFFLTRLLSGAGWMIGGLRRSRNPSVEHDTPVEHGDADEVVPRDLVLLDG